MSDTFDHETGELMPAVRPQTPVQNLIFASPECGEVFGALSEMQGAMEAPKRTKKAKVRGRTREGREYDYEYTYAPLDEVISAVKTPMKTAGLAYRQFLAERGGRHVMRTIIAHRTGQWFGCDYPIFWDESRGMQGFASGVTYARRYGLCLALGIAPEDDDDANVADGNAAAISQRPPARASEPRGAAKQSLGVVDGGKPASPTSAPQTRPDPKEERAQLMRRLSDIRNAIAEATDVELEAIEESQDLAELSADFTRVLGAQQGGIQMKQLEARIAKRRSEVLPGYEL